MKKSENQHRPPISTARPFGWQRLLATILTISLLGISGFFAIPFHTSATAVEEPEPSAYDGTFFINDVRFSPDASLGDGVCLTAQGTCTLLAAAQETNRLLELDSSKRYLVTITPQATPAELAANTGGILQLDGTHQNQGTILLTNSGLNIPSGPVSGMIPTIALMNTTVGRSIDGDTGAVFWFKGNVTIDLQKRLGTTPQGDAIFIGAVFAFTGKDQTLRNFANMYSSEGQIYVGHTAENFTLENGVIANSPLPSAGLLRYAVERPLVIVNGAKNVQIRNVEFNSQYRFPAVTVVASTDLTKTAINGLTITNSLFSMENSYLSGMLDSFGTGFGGFFQDATPTNRPRVNNLTIAGSTFMNSAGRRDTFADSGTWISTGNYASAAAAPAGPIARILLDNAQIYGNDFEQTRTPTDATRNVRNIAIYGGTSIGGGVKIFGNRTSWTAGVAPALPAIEMVRGLKADAHTSVVDNSFVGWNRLATGAVIAASAFDSVLGTGYQVEIARNVMTSVGGFTELGSTAATAAVEAGVSLADSLQNQIDNVGGGVTYPANGRLSTVVPNVTSPTLGEQCKIDVTLVAPTVGAAPAAAFNVDAFIGGDKGMSSYLGRVHIGSVSELPKTVSFWYGGSHDTQLLRVQTQDASGNSSQMSRTVKVAPMDCAPMVWVKAADSQEDPTFNRFIEFSVMSSKPLNGGLTAADISFLSVTGQAPEVYSIVPNTTDTLTNTQWKVIVKANATGLIAPYIAPGLVTDFDGETNISGSNEDGLPDSEGILRAPITFAGPGNPEGNLGVAISDLHDTVQYNIPIAITSPAELALTVAEPGDDPSQRAQFLVQLTSLDESGLPTFTPTSTLTLHPVWSDLIPDPSYVDPGQAANSIASTLANNLAINATVPTFLSVDRQTQVTVAAIDNLIVDGTRRVSLGTTIQSADPTFDGLTLSTIGVTVLDDDLPTLKITKTAWVGGAANPRLVTDGLLTVGQLTQWRFVLSHEKGIPLQGIVLSDNATLLPEGGVSADRAEPVVGCSPNSTVPTATVVSPADLQIQAGQNAVCWTAWVDPETGDTP